jgi:hypothetical protein
MQAFSYQKRPLPIWLLYAWFMFFILNPFLLFGSGLPQPADWLMAIIFTFIILYGYRFQTINENRLINRHRLFVIYVTLVNTVWFFFIDQSHEKRFPTFLHSLFYIFNFLALRSVIALASNFKKEFLKFTIYGIGLSLIIQASLAFLLNYTGTRNALFFNNPNQLGYYALLSGSLYVYGIKHVKVPGIFQLATYFSFFFITLLSSSKAALAGSIILISLAILNQGLVNIRQFVVLTITIGLGAYFVLNENLGSELFSYSINRFEMIGQDSDDTYQGRGYDRILNDPEYLVLGAGEGGYYRFNSLLEAGEIHSSFGTILFCYGIVGFVLFFRFLFAVFKGSSFFELLYFLPVFAYSITHQGLRDTLFWVFLGIGFVLNKQKLVKGVVKSRKYRRKLWQLALNKERLKLNPPRTHG